MRIILTAFATLVLLPLSLVAETSGLSNNEPREQCAALIKECLSKSFEERTNCFFSSAKHPFCEGTALGKLSYNRWNMSPNRPNLDEPSAFLGPRLVDQPCLSKFDDEFAAELQKDPELESKIDSLTATLEGCTKKITMELLRP